MLFYFVFQYARKNKLKFDVLSSRIFLIVKIISAWLMIHIVQLFSFSRVKRHPSIPSSVALAVPLNLVIVFI